MHMQQLWEEKTMEMSDTFGIYKNMYRSDHCLFLFGKTNWQSPEISY